LTLDTVSGSMITVGGRSSNSIAIEESLLENQALVITAPDQNGNAGASAQYWVRCLPHDFPQLSVTKPGAPPSGWYLTGNVNSAPDGNQFAMVLDNNGTPVWYRKVPSGGPW